MYFEHHCQKTRGKLLVECLRNPDALLFLSYQLTLLEFG
jgi:hypothetical protein